MTLISPTTPQTQITSPKSPRLLSLDVYRGLVILAMLIVNNLGDYATTGYFWKHADWPQPWLAESFKDWWQIVSTGAAPLYTAFTHFPLFKHCTLADYVMPSFMLIIGLSIPFSVASARSRNLSSHTIWIRVLKRSAVLVVLGWILCYFRDQFASWLYTPGAPFKVSLGMDVLQLLGVAYLVARILYELPWRPRLACAVALYLWHWALLRFFPQGDIPAGTFTDHHNAVGYIYSHVGVWSVDLIPHHLTLSWVGMLSVPPAAATMLLGTLASDHLRRTDIENQRRLQQLAFAGVVTALLGALWALDLPFNKPRWTPCYLLWVSGIGFLLIALLYGVLDSRPETRPAWTYPFVVFGSNALAAYFITILAKVLLLNTPRVTYHGQRTSLTNALISSLKSPLGPHLGGWTFTVLFIAFWWLVLDQFYRRKIFWRL